MFNILLDELPTMYSTYMVDTSFRVGIQMSQALDDSELSQYEKLQVCTMLLFGNLHPGAQECAEAIEWFLNGWNHDHHGHSSNVKAMDFDIDQGRIYSAFMAQYRINLNTADIHFWEFMFLLSNLEECAFTRVVDIRTKKITSKMSKEERQAYMDAKRTFRINAEVEKTEEDKLAEEDAVNEFRKYLGET